MEYKEILKIKSGQLEAYENMFSYTDDDLIKYNIPRLDNIKTWTVKFSNGLEMDIKVNSSEDDIWSEAVLFDENGRQLAFTEPSDGLSGEWQIIYCGDTYHITVIGED